MQAISPSHSKYIKYKKLKLGDGEEYDRLSD
jgi:hypothetical protein